MNTRKIAVMSAAAALASAALLAWILRSGAGQGDTPAADSTSQVVQDESGREVLYWYDPMVPAQRFERPGESPFMDMQLVPKYAEKIGDAAVRVSPGVQQNLGIRLATVEHMRFGTGISAAARVEADERRMHELPSRVPGYVERLVVRAAGDPVAAGQKVAEIYSPELLSAQRELLALSRADSLSGAESLVAAATERLRLLGMVDSEINSVMQRGEALSRFGMYAPASGFVTELAVREGAQIQSGATLMSIADLSSIWLIVEVPEREASRIRRGDHVTAHLESIPDQAFSGTVDYVYPALDAKTRTARVRIVAPNENSELRPGMFARATIAASQREALSVPSEAVIYTGSRSVVIVKDDAGFRPAQVHTGVEHDGRLEILSGLGAGEQVVASGQFLIDSEASLNGVLTRLTQAKPADAGQQHDSHHDEVQQ